MEMSSVRRSCCAGWDSLAYFANAVQVQTQGSQRCRRVPPGDWDWLGVEEHRTVVLLSGFLGCSRLDHISVAKVRDLEHMLEVDLG